MGNSERAPQGSIKVGNSDRTPLGSFTVGNGGRTPLGSFEVGNSERTPQRSFEVGNSGRTPQGKYILLWSYGLWSFQGRWCCGMVGKGYLRRQGSIREDSLKAV